MNSFAWLDCWGNGVKLSLIWKLNQIFSILSLKFKALMIINNQTNESVS